MENVGRENPFGSVCPRVVADNIDMVGKRNLRAGIETLIFGTNAVDLNTVGTSLIENIPIPAANTAMAVLIYESKVCELASSVLAKAMSVLVCAMLEKA